MTLFSACIAGLTYHSWSFSGRSNSCWICYTLGFKWNFNYAWQDIIFHNFLLITIHLFTAISVPIYAFSVLVKFFTILDKRLLEWNTVSSFKLISVFSELPSWMGSQIPPAVHCKYCVKLLLGHALLLLHLTITIFWQFLSKNPSYNFASVGHNFANFFWN